ncbi:MAG: hypothetical protein IJ656_03520 [Bacilli bacterium]|nr:hypothetical protein [Bacilli bacterium]
MANIFKKGLKLIGIIACSISFLVSCSNKNESKPSQNEEEVITKILEESDPMAEVFVGPFEKINEQELKTVENGTKTFGSSTILDMPKDMAINIVYDNEENRSLQSTACFLNDIVDSNNDVRLISIKDRGGNFKNNTLSTDGKKITVSSPGGFQYGEVYQIDLNSAPYLSFEGKDPKIRQLTIEIEDNPAEQATYDVKEEKDGIIKIDRSKIVNKKQNKNDGTYTFEYNGEFPNLKKGDIFFACIESSSDPRLDFYGVFDAVYTVNAKKEIKYHAPNLDEIYNNFHIKGVEKADLSEAEVLLTSDFAVQQFKASSLGRGLVRTLLSITPEDYRKVIDIIRHLNIDISINLNGSKVEMKIALRLGSFQISDNEWIAIEIGHQSITDFTFDFDVKLSYTWIFPSGVDYKVKCIQDSSDVWYFKFAYDHQPIEAISQSDTDYANKLLDDITKSLDGENSRTGELLNPDKTKATTAGTKTTLPLVWFDINYFTPLQIRFKVDFYFDIGIQAIGLVKYESESTKIDFNFSNMDGGSTDSSEEMEKASNIFAYIGGNFHAELGLRISLGISLLGLYDYLHIEGYASAYVNLTISGMIGMDIDLLSNEVSGYYSIDLHLSCGVKAGLDIKLVITSFSLQTIKSWSLFRLKYENPLEHWSDKAETTINMDKETLSIDETNVLIIKYFDLTKLSILEKKYEGSDKFSLFSGILCPESLIKASSANIFEYKVEDPTKIEISKDGLIHVKDGTESSFTTHFIIHINNLAGFISDRVITINYTTSDIKDVYAGEKLIGQYRPNYELTLPEPEKIRGKEFEYYSYNGKNYKVGEKFIVPSESCELELHYRDLPTYRVYFYDGYGILVSIDEVYEGEDAHEPLPSIRDRYMDKGWEFFYWDRSIKNVQHELHVSGCYILVD